MLQMKKTQSLLKFFLIGSILTFSFTVAAFADDMGMGQVKAASAEILSEPYAEAQLIESLPEGHPARILEILGEFYKISFGSKEAYIRRNDFAVVAVAGVVNDTQVNIRDYPSKNGKIIGTANTNEGYTAKGISGDWYMIEYRGGSAYIHKDYLNGSLLNVLKSVEPSSGAAQSSDNDSFAVVEANTGLNLRNQASLDGKVIQVLRKGAVLDVLDAGEEWLAVDYNGALGYVNMDFVSVVTGERPMAVASSRADEVISYAKQFLGTPYKYAGTNLNSGVDCSGFVYSVMKHFGISLNRSSRDMVRNGEKVSKSQLTPGDLVFFDTNGGSNNGNISHVGIYIGDGKFIHSSSSQRTWGVVISSLGEDYYIRNYVSAVRVLS